MGVSAVTYGLAKKYTDETAHQFGGLKGASCTIKSINHQDGQNVVTFEWENNSGEKRTSVMYVEDGTPIYTWTAGDTYHYGDLVIYASAFYRCIVENSDSIFDDTKWNEIGSPDGNYDIVQNSSLLPPRFTAADTKMYYCIEEGLFYLWDGSQWVRQNKLIQFVTMPNPSIDNLDIIVQYIGNSNENYINGYFYKCEYKDSEYTWINIDTQYSSTVAKTGTYNDLINRPMTYLIGESNPIIISELENGFYCIVGSYCFYTGGTINIATSKKYFTIESLIEDNETKKYITEINSKKIKRYVYTIEKGITEDSYALINDVEDILDNEFDSRADFYVSEKEASEEDIENLFSI